MKALYLVSLLLLSDAAQAAELPPPGLYRIDFDGTMQFAGNPTQVRSTTDGGSGDTTAVWKDGKREVARQFKGNAPVTHCIKPSKGGVPLPPQAQACTGQTTTAIKDGWITSASCPSMNIRLTIRQLDKDRWEYVNDVTMVTTGAAPSMAGMEMILKQQAEHGATAEERAKARQQLAQLPAMQKESDAQYADTIAHMREEMNNTTDPEEKAAIQTALARMAPGNPTMHGASRQIWTRIGKACK